MFEISQNNDIQLTRGDTARFRVHITCEDSNKDVIPYEIADTDTLTLSVKKNVKDFKPLFQKVITGSDKFHIKPEDTANLDFGKYRYDVQLNKSNSDVHTVVPTSVFEILQEVT